MIETCHLTVTPHIWHVTCVGWTFSKNFSFLAFTVLDWQFLEDSERKDDLIKQCSVWKLLNRKWPRHSSYFWLESTFIYTRRYSPLCEPTTCSSCGGLRPSAQAFFPPFRQKKDFLLMFWPILGHFWCSLVTLVTVRSNLSNFKNYKKIIVFL